MFKKIKNKDKLDFEKLNDSISLLTKILRIAYILIIIVAVFVGLKLCQELKIINLSLVILKILMPLFIGLFLAWLFAPLVKKLNKKGLNRGLGTTLVYVICVGFLIIVVSSMIPVLSDQINDFVSTLPSIFESIKNWITDIFDKIGDIESIDAESLKTNIFEKIEIYGSSLAKALPEIMVNVVKTLASGVGTFVIGLIIGFYLLIGFDNAEELIITLVPKKLQNDARELGNEMNNSLRKYINGALIDCFFVFIITSIVFAIIGLKSPLLLGLFCGITNIIPYAGPYIGGAPAVIVGLSQNPITGILTLVSIVVIQFLEGNLLQPFIMSKTTKLHPVTIMIGLLIFGHFFGIMGMVVSTPIIAVLKSVCMFFIYKFEIDLFEND